MSELVVNLVEYKMYFYFFAQNIRQTDIISTKSRQTKKSFSGHFFDT